MDITSPEQSGQIKTLQKPNNENASSVEGKMTETSEIQPISKDVYDLINAMADPYFTPRPTPPTRAQIIKGFDYVAFQEQAYLAIEQARKSSANWVEPPPGYTRLYAPRRNSTINSSKPPGRWYTNYELRAREALGTVASKSGGGGILVYTDVPTDKVPEWIPDPRTNTGSTAQEQIGKLNVQQIIVPQEIANQAKPLPEPILKPAIATEPNTANKTTSGG